jgi:hypothetical protein
VCGEVDGGNELWLETIPDLEWGLSRGTMGSDIVGEFGKGEEVNPVVLLEVAKDTEKLFDFLVDSFCFSICLWVECGGQGGFDTEFLP